jgi:hypothetical protein
LIQSSKLSPLFDEYAEGDLASDLTLSKHNKQQQQHHRHRHHHLHGSNPEPQEFNLEDEFLSDYSADRKAVAGELDFVHFFGE